MVNEIRCRGNPAPSKTYAAGAGQTGSFVLAMQEPFTVASASII